MKNIIVSVVIVSMLLAVGFFAWRYFSAPKQSSTVETSGNQQPATSTSVSQTPGSESQNTGQSSEQLSQAKYDEYLSDIYLGKMDIGKEIGTDGFPVKTNVFTKGVDQFCTMIVLKKAVVSGHIATAIYDTVLKTYQTSKTVFPMALKVGGIGGCDNIDQVVGKYEYKLYLDDVLTSVISFEVK